MNAARPHGRSAALITAVIITVTAVIATVDNWHGAPSTLRELAAHAWVVYALLACTDRVIDAIRDLIDRVERHGDERHAEGVLEGIHNATPPATPTQLRRR
ncbi:hypothetical protein [Dactylosporangium sp. CA-139066]|uniref:hypothetical protein n=1 Tax=Dactylosporangium sp. CA-139066 TaxID=3239930 RepID=UPI003D8B52AA